METIVKIKQMPFVVKNDDGKERTSTGRWSLVAIAHYVRDHPATMFTGKELARLGYDMASKRNFEAARKYIRQLANLLESENIAVVVEFKNRKLNGIQVYNKDREYHQQLMADEINRRKLRADGSAEKLEELLKFLPTETTN